MSIPNYVIALANHQGPANVVASGMSIPVKIMDIEHDSSWEKGDETTFKCLIVNQDQLRPRGVTAGVKEYLNRIYSAPRPCRVSDLVIEDVRFGDTTAVIWKDGTKTSIIYPEGTNPSKEYSLALCFTLRRLGIAKVVFNNPVTVVLWRDGTKTVVKCQDGDIYHMESGLTLCITKKMFGNKGNFNDIFHKWIPEEENDAASQESDTNPTPPCVSSDLKDEEVAQDA